MVSFVKFQGAGNDFILIDDRTHSFDISQVRSLCHRQFGIGADGVILLQNDLRMRIFNSDGSEAESCGNGLRCLMKFLLHLGFPRQSYRITTGHRIVEADFIGDRIRVQMGAPRDVQQTIIDGYTIYSLDTGVPHAVIFVADVQALDLMTLGPFFRHHPAFQPRGVNVNFAQIQSDGSIRVRTYERGLEGESLACGTGAAAVAVIASQCHGLSSPIQIHFPGGSLEICINGSEVQMIGDAVKIFEGTSFVM